MSGGMPYQQPIGVVPRRLNAALLVGIHITEKIIAKPSALFYEFATNDVLL